MTSRPFPACRLSMAVFLALLTLLAVSPCLAANGPEGVHKQAWQLDPAQGEPAPGHEAAFAKDRESLASFIEVFQVIPEPAGTVIYLFQAKDGFFVTNITAALSSGDDGWFILTGPKLSPDTDNIWYYKLRDRDTLVHRRASGTYVYKRLPDFNPPKDEFTGLNPLPWK